MIPYNVLCRESAHFGHVGNFFTLVYACHLEKSSVLKKKKKRKNFLQKVKKGKSVERCYFDTNKFRTRAF